MTTAEKHKFPMARTCPFAPPPAPDEPAVEGRSAVVLDDPHLLQDRDDTADAQVHGA